MHFYITGGTGRNGSLTIAAALAGGHTVTALVRDPSSASIQPYAADPNLTLVTGSPLSRSAVAEALVTPRRPDAVISTLSLARVSTSPFAALRPDTLPDFMSRTTRVLLDAIASIYSDDDDHDEAPSRTRPKIIINSTLGAGDSWSSLSWVFRLLFSHSPMRHGVADHNAVDALVRESGLRFVLARAGRLAEQKGDSADESATAAVRVLPDNGNGLGVADAITRQSLAKWLVRAAEQDTWDSRSPVLIN